MKKYTKPVVEIVSLKSSENIARTTFKELRQGFIEKKKYNGVEYAVSQYAITNSSIPEVDA